MQNSTNDTLNKEIGSDITGLRSPVIDENGTESPATDSLKF